MHCSIGFYDARRCAEQFFPDHRLKVPIVLFLVGLFLVAALACLTIGAFSRSARRQRRFVILCAALLVPSLILSSLIALGQGA